MALGTIGDKLAKLLTVGLFGVSTLAAVEVEGLSVDRHSRNAVALFWHQFYMPSEDYFEEYGPVPNVFSGSVPTPRQEFRDDVQRRVNFYRAMVGLPGDISFEDSPMFLRVDDEFTPPAGASKNQACMEMSLLMARHTTPSSPFITHDLPSTTSGFTTSAWNAALNSNLTIGFYGVGAIDNYMSEPGTATNALFNREVPHRRWLLYPPATHMATGDIPPTQPSGGGPPTFPTNTLYVLDDFSGRSWERQFSSWPNDGYTPAQLVPKFWSLSFSQADFGSASITMTGPNGENIPVTILSRSLGIDEDGSGSTGQDGATTGPQRVVGESTIVWEPRGIATVNDVRDQDLTYTVTMTGNTGAGASSHTYTVTLINPDRVGESLELFGSSTPPREGASYVFDPVELADSYDFQISVERPVNWVEGGEGTSNGLITQSPRQVPISEVRSSARKFTGSRSLCLSFPAPVLGQARELFQSIEIDRSFVPQSGSSINFQMYRGVQLSTSVTSLEVTKDDGASWEKLWDILGSFVNGQLFQDGTFEPHVVSLSGYEGESVRMRFIMRRPESFRNSFFHYGFQVGSGLVTGNYIDDLQVAGAIGVEPLPLVSVSGDSEKVRFDDDAVGEDLTLGVAYRLQIRPVLDDVPFQWGPEITVVASDSNLTDWDYYRTFEEPGLTDFAADSDEDGVQDGLEFILGRSALDPSDGALQGVPSVRDGRLMLTIPKDEAIPNGVIVGAEFSFDGENWFTDGAMAEIFADVIELSAPLNGQGRMFLRLTVDLE